MNIPPELKRPLEEPPITIGRDEGSSAVVKQPTVEPDPGGLNYQGTPRTNAESLAKKQPQS